MFVVNESALPWQVPSLFFPTHLKVGMGGRKREEEGVIHSFFQPVVNFIHSPSLITITFVYHRQPSFLPSLIPSHQVPCHG